MSPFDRPRIPERFLLRCVGPLRDPARLVGTRRARTVHAIGPEGAEQRPIEQRAVAEVQDAGRTGGERGHGQRPDILGLHDATVFLVAAEHLRLQPERTAGTFGVPPLLAARGGAGDVGPEEVLPGLEAAAARHPGEPIELDLAGGEPVVGAAGRHVGDGAAKTVRRDQAVLVDGPDRVDAPLHLAVVVVALELEPVEVFGVRRDRGRRLDIVPLGIGVAVPVTPERLEVAVLGFEPLAEVGLHPVGVVDVGRVVDLVPDIVAQERRRGPCSAWRAR